MSTRRMVYAQIANAVLAGYPEPQETVFDPATVWLRFDTHAAAKQWARWLSTDCFSTFYTATTKDEWSLACYYGERSGWQWSIVGRERSLTPQEYEATSLDGNDLASFDVAAYNSALLAVRCPRCGHDEAIHEDEEPGTARCCLDCKGFCVPVVLVPAHVQGWAIDGRTGK